MRYAIAIGLAVTLSTVSVGAQDVCAGAMAPKAASRRMDAPTAAPVSAPVAGRAGAQAAVGGGAVGVARGVSLYPGGGAGPLPDITGWQPRGKIAAGTELIIQGRNLVPGQLIALLGGSQLTATTQSTSEIRFRVTEVAAASPLIVYNTNGQPKTLESAYLVYDPTPYITRVVPSSFGQGDMVTICGTSLYDAFFDDMYSLFPVTGVPNLGQVKQAMGKFVRLGQNWLEIVNPSVSPAGDRITFQAGSVDTTARACNGRASCSSPAGITDFAAPFPTMPASVSGPLTVRLSGVNRWVLGPALTWTPPVPRITRVYGKLIGDHDPFLILPTASTFDFPNIVHVDGMNIEWAHFKVGTTEITDYSGPSAVHTGLQVPLNVSSGPVCAVLGGRTACSPRFEIFGGPVITRTPTMPLALKTNYTIEGLNLLPPPGAVGLKYTLVERLGQLDPTMNPSVVSCNMVLQVVEQTANRIVFRIGDPAITTPPPASCNFGWLYQAAAPRSLNIQASLVGERVQRQLLRDGISFYAKP